MQNRALVTFTFIVCLVLVSITLEGFLNTFDTGVGLPAQLRVGRPWTLSSDLDQTSGDVDAAKTFQELRTRRPFCMIMGFPKCGTVALRDFLAFHPDVLAWQENLMFPSEPRDLKETMNWLDQQAASMSPREVLVMKVKRGSSFKKALPMIISNVSILMIMLDPVWRSRPMYVEYYRRYPSEPSVPLDRWILQQFIPYTYGYLSFTEQILDMFPRSQTFFVDGGALIQKPVPVLREIEQFLNLRPAFHDGFFRYNVSKGFYCANTNTVNTAGLRRIDPETGCLDDTKGRPIHPELSKDMIRYLANLFQDHNKKLFQLIGKTFNWTTANSVL